MADFGIKASQQGADVSGTADWQQLFSSSWPNLKIAFQGRATINRSDTNQTIITHNLGYVPIFWIFNVASNSSRFSSYGYVTNGTYGGYCGANSTEIKYFTNIGNASSIDVYYYVFAQPITEDFESPIIVPTPGYNINSDRDYGIKATKEGKDISSTDLRDFTIHSGTISPSIHQISTGVPTLTGDVQPLAKMFKTYHSLGSAPFSLCYIKYGANGAAIFDVNYWYSMGGASGVNYIRFYTTDTFVSLEEDYDLVGGVAPTATVSLILLKEPFSATGESGTTYQWTYV